tara:strand:- start:25388 stop:26224 length:837 start_codon:yes stop_codon:yes gene_type:complete
MTAQSGLFNRGIYGQDVPRQTFQGEDLYADQAMAPDNKYDNGITDYAGYDQAIANKLAADQQGGGSGGGNQGGGLGSTIGKVAGGLYGAAGLYGLGKDLGLLGGGSAAAKTAGTALAGAGGVGAALGGGAVQGATGMVPGAMGPLAGGMPTAGMGGAGSVGAGAGFGGAYGGFTQGGSIAGLGGVGALALPIALGLFGGKEQPSTVNADQDRLDDLNQEYYDNMYAKAGVADAEGYQDMMQASDVWQTPMTQEEMFRAEAEKRGVADIDEYMAQNYTG